MLTLKNLLKVKYLIFFILGITIPATAFAVFSPYLHKKEGLNLPEAVYFSNHPLPKSQLLRVESNIDDYEKVTNGRVFLFHFATGCAYSKREIEVISESLADLEAAKVKVFGVSSEDTSVLKEFLKKNNLNFPVLFDKDAILYKDLQIKYAPTNFMIENGIIEKTWFGSPRNKEALLKEIGVRD